MARWNYTDGYTSVEDEPEPVRLTPAARRILDVASGLFYARGIGAVGVDTIAAEAGVTKKTIYDRFRSKDNLIAAYLRERDQRYRVWLTDWISDDPDTPPLLAVFDALHRWMEEHGPRGCAFVNAYAELADPDHAAHRIARAQKEWLLDLFTDLAARDGAEGAGTLALEVLTLHEGATVLRSTAGRADAAATAHRAATTLLDAARVSPGGGGGTSGP